MKKTILFLDQQSWLGGGQRVLEAVLGSVGAEFDPIVAFPDGGPFRTVLDRRGIATLTVPFGNYQSGKKSYLEMAAFALRSLFCGLKLAGVIRRRRVDLVYVNGPRCLPAGVFAAWLTGRPSLFHLHLILTRRVELYLVTRLVRRVSWIVACSRAAAQPLVDADYRLSQKTEVLYSPVRFPPPPPEERWLAEGQTGWSGRREFTIGIVGRITQVKGHHLLLEAIGNLPPEIKDRVRILIVGAPAPESEEDSSYAGYLRTIAIRCGLQKNIAWAGFQTDPSHCYDSMDVLVHPALWAEAMGLVILEALQRGIPVIAARIGGIPEIVDDGLNCLLVAPGDEVALGQALARFIEDGSLREHLRQGARSCVDDRFTLKSFSPKIRLLVWRLSNLHFNQGKTLNEEFPKWK